MQLVAIDKELFISRQEVTKARPARAMNHTEQDVTTTFSAKPNHHARENNFQPSGVRRVSVHGCLLDLGSMSI